MLSTEDFDFDLPEELIAQTPLKDRASSRLLVVNKETGDMEDKHFHDILDELQPGDALVMNNTRVLPRINAQGTTVVMATHNSTIVNTIRHRVIAIENGRIIRDQVEGEYGYDD